MVGFGLYGNQGVVEGLPVFGNVLIIKLFVPQTDKILLHLLFAYGGVTFICAGAHT